MTLVSPLSTVHTPAGFTAADILQVMADQFNVSTKFEVALIATGGVTNGFTAQSLTDTVPRYIFRRTGAQTIAVSFQPSGGCSSVGDTVTVPTVGTPSIWSGEKTWTVSGSTGTIVLMSELDDAFFVMVTNSARTFFTESCAIGRLVDIDDAGDIALGRDGLGACLGAPGYTTSGLYWFNNQTTSASRNNMFRMATTVYCSGQGNPTTYSGSATNVGFARPSKNSLNVNVTGSAGATTSSPILLKYIRSAPETGLPRRIIYTNNATNQGWMYVNFQAVAVSTVIPWDRTVVPDV